MALPQVLPLFRHLIQFTEVLCLCSLTMTLECGKKNVGKTHYKIKSTFTGKKRRAFGISGKLRL